MGQWRWKHTGKRARGGQTGVRPSGGQGTNQKARTKDATPTIAANGSRGNEGSEAHGAMGYELQFFDAVLQVIESVTIATRKANKAGVIATLS